MKWFWKFLSKNFIFSKWLKNVLIHHWILAVQLDLGWLYSNTNFVSYDTLIMEVKKWVNHHFVLRYVKWRCTAYYILIIILICWSAIMSQQPYWIFNKIVHVTVINYFGTWYPYQASCKDMLVKKSLFRHVVSIPLLDNLEFTIVCYRQDQWCMQS